MLDTRFHQFDPHVDGKGDRDEPGDRRDHQVEDADILVVRRHEPTREETARVVVTVVGV